MLTDPCLGIYGLSRLTWIDIEWHPSSVDIYTRTSEHDLHAHVSEIAVPTLSYMLEFHPSQRFFSIRVPQLNRNIDDIIYKVSYSIAFSLPIYTLGSGDRNSFQRRAKYIKSFQMNASVFVSVVHNAWLCRSWPVKIFRCGRQQDTSIYCCRPIYLSFLRKTVCSHLWQSEYFWAVCFHWQIHTHNDRVESLRAESRSRFGKTTFSDSLHLPFFCVLLSVSSCLLVCPIYSCGYSLQLVW